MTILSKARVFARKFGLDISRYDILNNPSLRTTALLRQQLVDLVVDVGANDGGYGRELRATGYNGPILSFEPLSAAHAALTQAAKNEPNWIIAPRMALGARAETATINIAGNSKSSSLLGMLGSHEFAAPSSIYVSKETCTVSRLDQVEIPALATAQRIFLKIDTQGFEEQVFDGARGISSRVIGLQCELSLDHLYVGQKLIGDLFEKFENEGFKLWNVIPGFIDQRTGRMLQVDGVFFRTSAENKQL